MGITGVGGHSTRRKNLYWYSVIEGWCLAPRPGRFTPGKDQVPIVEEAGWAPGPVWTCAKNLAPTGIRSPDRPARSQSLYRLNYPVRISIHLTNIIISHLYVFSIISTKTILKLDAISNERTSGQSRFRISHCSLSTKSSAPNACLLLVPWTSGVPKLDNQHCFIISVMSLGIQEFSSSCIT
jgi:hypothetical protein